MILIKFSELYIAPSGACTKINSTASLCIIHENQRSRQHKLFSYLLFKLSNILIAEVLWNVFGLWYKSMYSFKKKLLRRKKKQQKLCSCTPIDKKGTFNKHNLSPLVTHWLPVIWHFYQHEGGMQLIQTTKHPFRMTRTSMAKPSLGNDRKTWSRPLCIPSEWFSLRVLSRCVNYMFDVEVTQISKNHVSGPYWRFWC